MPQTAREPWEKLLGRLSARALGDRELRDRLVRRANAGWLGGRPASERRIRLAETRLGHRLPPSYRAFLSISNGWNCPSPFVSELAGVEHVGWTQDIVPDLVASWAEVQRRIPPIGTLLTVAPEEALAETILISRPRREDDGAFFMLNPKVRRGEEMEAWFFADWNAGASVFPSFWDLMVRVCESHFLQPN